MDDDEEDDDEKDLIADEIFHGDGEGDLEEGEAVDEPLHRGDDDEEGEDEESGKLKGFYCRAWEAEGWNLWLAALWICTENLSKSHFLTRRYSLQI